VHAPIMGEPGVALDAWSLPELLMEHASIWSAWSGLPVACVICLGHIQG
jgi:hypothetical protein